MLRAEIGIFSRNKEIGMSSDGKANIYASYDEFCEAYGLPKPHRIEVDRNKVDSQELTRLTDCLLALCLDLTIYLDLFANEQAVTVLDRFSPLIFTHILKEYV